MSELTSRHFPGVFRLSGPRGRGGDVVQTCGDFDNLQACINAAVGHEAWSWAVLLGLVLVWALLVRAIQQPPYLSSLVVALPEHAVLQDWASAFYQVDAIEDVVVLPAENVAYLKVDKQRLDEAARQKLSQILGYPVAI